MSIIKAAPYGSHFFGSLVKSAYLIIHKRTIDVTERRLELIDMEKRYLLYKFCRDGDRHLITWLTASGVEEANLAVKLLRKNHPQEQDLTLGEGEFFEIIEENQLKSGEWEQAMEALSLRKVGLYTVVAKEGNND
jgi:hypothetical protein